METFSTQTHRPSVTARAAAAHRAVHQLLEGGAVFSDPLALPILGPGMEEALAVLPTDSRARRMRRFIAARTRLAEEALHAAIEKDGITQLVVLGAGLDTYAYRGAQRGALRAIYEVDHPGTQAWKRERLAAAGIDAPSNVHFVATNFEEGALEAALQQAGLDRGQGVFFTWLGVTPYLSRKAIRATLSLIAASPRSQVVFDYAEPPDTLDPRMRAMHDSHAQRVALIGEPWVSFFEPPALHSELRDLGFNRVHDAGPGDIARFFFPDSEADAPARGGHVLHAARD